MIWEPPLSWCIVDCDGSVCGSGNVARHIHQPQFPPWWATPIPAAHVHVDNGRVTYTQVAS
jgi:hypothetical protein